MMEGRAGSQEQPLTLEGGRFWQLTFHSKLWTIKTGKKKPTDRADIGEEVECLGLEGIVERWIILRMGHELDLGFSGV